MSEEKRDWMYIGRFEIPEAMQQMMAEARARFEKIEDALSFLACHHQRREAISGGRPKAFRLIIKL